MLLNKSHPLHALLLSLWYYSVVKELNQKLLMSVNFTSFIPTH